MRIDTDKRIGKGQLAALMYLSLICRLFFEYGLYLRCCDAKTTLAVCLASAIMLGVFISMLTRDLTKGKCGRMSQFAVGAAVLTELLIVCKFALSFFNSTYSQSAAVTALIIVLAVAVYAGFRGLEGTARLAVIVLLLFSVVFIAVICGNAGNFDAENFSIRARSYPLPLAILFLRTAFPPEAALWLILVKRGRVNGWVNKRSLALCVMPQILAVIIYKAIVEWVFGEFSLIRLFPFNDLASTAVNSGAWDAREPVALLGALLLMSKLSLLVFTFTDTFQTKKGKYLSAAILSVLCVAASILLRSAQMYVCILFLVSFLLTIVYILIANKESTGES